MYEPPKRHRKSGINFEELLNKEWSILTKAEYSELQTSFKRTDQRNGGICFYDLINILRSTAPITDRYQPLHLRRTKGQDQQGLHEQGSTRLELRLPPQYCSHAQKGKR